MAAIGVTLPAQGSVLGIDVGWSLRAASSGICRIDWDATSVRWTLAHFTGDPERRRQAVKAGAGDRPLLAVALDGPLRGDLAVIDRYRAAERVLSVKAIASRISQPGSSRSPIGRLLNHHTNEFARLVQDAARVAPATHDHAVLPTAIVEAFPTSFLGLLLDAPEKGVRLRRSDRYWEALVADRTLERLLAHHLPGRVPALPLASITHHDERAALVCALTALGVARRDYTAVGDGEDGWIILPPPHFIAPWARALVA